MNIKMSRLIVDPFRYFPTEGLVLEKGQRYCLVQKQKEDGSVGISFLLFDEEETQFVEELVNKIRSEDELAPTDLVIPFRLDGAADDNTIYGRTIPEDNPISFHIPYRVSLE